MLVLLFLVVYLLPVLPVARRVHYVRTKAVLVRVVPAREIRKKISVYAEVNGCTKRAVVVCDNCGGDENCHPGGGYYDSLGKNGSHPQYTSCENFERWDGVDKDTPELPIYREQDKAIPVSILLSLGFWWYFVAAEVSKRAYYAVEPDWSNFAVEYKGAETKAQKIERLQGEVAAANARSDRILESVDKVRTLEELDALVKD
jgi:hypothetical protein